ncbi:SpoIIE family protein phosphatase [Streptomyces sp. 2224.1]|uniref:SpoIIE family protein phosphatase n=1 Tax=Streptomyces sp. 2224.1 TaxID=1881020 RepID=UPI000B86B7AE|nr:SpoIIE family protein phosphatase [Streptomyces sp. 2224.1]
MGPLRIASAYRAADDEALIRGDLYAATRTGDGARLLIGDVRGKGMTAINDASVIMGSFRDAAHRCATLAELAVTLEESICRHLNEHAPHPEADELYEQFVTVLIPVSRRTGRLSLRDAPGLGERRLLDLLSASRGWVEGTDIGKALGVPVLA